MTLSKSRILSIALAISVAVNLIVGGFIAAQWIDYGMGKKRHGGYHFDRHAAFRTLSSQEQAELKKLWKARRDALRPYFRQYGKDREALSELFSADKLDLAKIDKTYSDMIDTQMQIEKLFQASLLEMAKTLKPDQRQRFFKEGFRPPRKFPGPEKDAK
ncbi:MAG: periplasmic heavy metal sensor [Alphaproteobacteria bacterium]|nr:MAG: periplasmic heavy metal sensor [Alphaproteobacteria bacterium]